MWELLKYFTSSGTFHIQRLKFCIECVKDKNLLCLDVEFIFFLNRHYEDSEPVLYFWGFLFIWKENSIRTRITQFWLKWIHKPALFIEKMRNCVMFLFWTLQNRIKRQTKYYVPRKMNFIWIMKLSSDFKCLKIT